MIPHPFTAGPDTPMKCRCGSPRDDSVHKVEAGDPLFRPRQRQDSGQINVPTPLIALVALVVLAFFAYEEFQPQIDAVRDWLNNAWAWVQARPR